MKKRNPIYSVGSFLLAGALTLSMAACSRGNDPFRAGIRRTPREGLAAQAGRGKPLHGKE